MAPRPDVSDLRQAQILNAAAAVFARRGLDGARMEDIADEAGLSKGTLYLYFEGKEDLIRSLLERFYDEALSALPEMVDAPGSATERLLAVGRIAVANSQQILQEAPLTLEFYAVAARQEAIQRFLVDYFNQIYDMLAAIIRQGIDSGEFRPLDPHAVAVTIGALFEGLGLLWMIDPTSVDWERHSAVAFTLLLDGLRGSGPTGTETV